MWKLHTGVPITGGVAWHDAPGVGMGLLLLPAHDDEYQWQSSRFPGIRGNPQRPVAAIVSTPVGWAAELYSSMAGPDVTIAKALYQPVPRIQHDAILLPPLLYHDIIQRIALLVSQCSQWPGAQ